MAIRREQRFSKNFYAVDVETNGFDHNEPLQIAIVRYEDGVEADHVNVYLKAQENSTKSAIDTHGLTKKRLRELNAKKFGKRTAKMLISFLKQHDDLPIVAFFADYERDKVLTPAFQRLGLDDMAALTARWRCAQQMSMRTRNWKVWTLDDALSYFGLDRRDEEEQHDALQDARLAAQVYMKAMILTPLSEGDLGFINGEEE